MTTRESAARHQPASVLVVEDHCLVAEDLRVTLSGLGYRVTNTVACGVDAVQAARKEPPDLVLMDIHIQGQMDGIRAAEMIGNQLSIPVVFLTAHSDEATLARAVQARPYGYILKPFNERDLRCALQVALVRGQVDAKLQSLSHFDELTGLYNRRGFFELAEQQLRLADRTKRSLTIVFGDLDEMKRINDVHGHETGDLALRDAASVLRSCFRDTDLIARIGGDEFAVMALDSDRSAEHALRARIAERVADRNSTGDRVFELSISVGFAHYDSERPRPLAALLAEADRAMYVRKERRRTCDLPRTPL
jgi:diguanylate cyclase (GGDEF)-like protein